MLACILPVILLLEGELVSLIIDILLDILYPYMGVIFLCEEVLSKRFVESDAHIMVIPALVPILFPKVGRIWVITASPNSRTQK